MPWIDCEMLILVGSCRFYSKKYHPSPITCHSYIDDDFLSLVSKKQIAQHLSDLGAFPSFSSILTPQHFYQNEVLMKYSKQKPHPVSLRQLAGYGKTLTKQKILASANFVRIELPIRLAMRIRDLQTLPFGVVNNFHLAQIYESYYHSFNAFRKIPQVTTLSENDEFCRKISTLLDQHVFNLSHLMMGALESCILNTLRQEELDMFMSSMLRSRISRRRCEAREHFNIVADTVKKSMLEHFPNEKNLPDLNIEGDVKTSFPFMVPHLHYLFGEILRNSYQATIKTHGSSSNKKLPPIKITIIDTKKQVMFRISDEGGGISHKKLASIWSFGKNPELARQSLANFHRIPGLQMYSNLQVTPAGSSIVDNRDALGLTSVGDIGQVSTKEKKSTLEQLTTRPNQYKLGLGLPMCKVYADYWNGDLTMNSLEGYGSDTCLTLSKLGYHSSVNQLDRA
ncbi:hypothetical protein E0198_001012 [Clavispora lusitaniae]|nr:hypothetical protein E0198_001012 [Clavispora lusitaniae]